jgi:hypothetical protein
MRTRILAFGWLVLGAAIWCGVFDLYISRGARYYGQIHAEYELHRIQQEPLMAVVMAQMTHDGVVAATLWAGVVVIAGWMTIWLRER